MNSMHKDWESWFFFQMFKSQKSITGHTKKQGSVAQSKEWNKVPESDAKEMQISDAQGEQNTKQNTNKMKQENDAWTKCKY